MVTVAKKKDVAGIIESVVRQNWGWSPQPPSKRLTIEQQLGMIREELAFEFRSRGYVAQSIEARETRDGKHGLVVECIVSGAVHVKQYEPHENNLEDGNA